MGTKAMQLKNVLHQGLGLPFIFGRPKIHYTSHVVALCDTRILPFHSNCQNNNTMWSKPHPYLHQTFPSATFHHTSSSRSMSVLDVCSVPLQASVINYDCVNSELLKPKLLFCEQIRSVHKYYARRRVSRTYSSNRNSLTPSEQSTDEGKDVNEDGEKKLNLYQRFKKTYKEHGKVLVVVHVLTSAVWLGSFYTAARCGVDIVPLLESWNLSEKVINPFRSGGLGDVALAYLMYKLATPARYTVTIGGTNMVIRHLRKGGKMQQVAKQDTLREMYKEGKANLKNRSINTSSRLKNMRGSIQGRIRNRLRNMRGKIQSRIRRGRKRRGHEKKDS